ncbi:hypothetical protein [Anaerococcus marasmi]|uniref:hypothetical protein n=1 Tax=Anaerococcus marasmi TaxID=2057797 RepID=UPI000CF961C6|nr:hypothetical protein [Anaerococcus marasmi]
MLTYEEFKKRSPEVEITEGLFLSLQRRIRRRIDFLTFERISEGDKNLQKRIDEVTEDIINGLYFKDKGLLNNSEGNSSGEIKSETVGQHKVEYVQANTLSTDKKDRIVAGFIDQMIKEAFIHTGLMYRGVDVN